MREKLFCFSMFGFLGGVALHSLLPLGMYAVLFFLCVALLLLFLRERTSIMLALMCVFFSLGIVRMHVGIVVPEHTLGSYEHKKVVLEGVVVKEPDVREKSVRLTISLSSIASTTVKGRVLVIAPAYSSIFFGDRVRVEGTLTKPESFDTGLGRAFNYPAFLAKDGITHQVSFAKVDVIGRNVQWYQYPIAGAIWIKEQFQHGLGEVLGEPHAALAAGITVGDKRGIGNEWSSMFQTVGLTHIIVLSGYNIMIVITFLLWLLSGQSARIQIGVGGGIALFFIFMTGFASATVRAACMALIAVVGRVSGREYLAARALAVVAIGIVCWNPYVLLFDPGFQLSVLATAGLIFITPIISEKLLWVTVRYGLREIIASTLGAQIAVLPLILYQTGLLSIVALPANIVVLVAVPYAMAAAFFAGVCGALFGSFAVIVAAPAYLLLSYILYGAQLFAGLPFASIQVSQFSFVWVACTYMPLALFVYIKEKAGH